MPEREELPEGFKMTELGPLPEEWKVVRLGTLLETSKLFVQNGFAQGAHNQQVKVYLI